MIRCGKLDDPKSFALMVVKSFAMLMDEGVVLCDVVVVGVSLPLRSCLASSLLTSSMILFFVVGKDEALVNVHCVYKVGIHLEG